MHRLNYGLLLFSLTVAPLAMTGCGGGGGSDLDTQYVEGVVTLDGKPVPDATVTFVPVTAGQGASATGYTDANGVYKLTAVAVGETSASGEAEAGTLPGEYLVGVTKSVTVAPMSAEEAETKGIPYKEPSVNEVPKTTHVVPQKYNDPQKSGLKATVTDGENTIPLELKSG